MIYYLVGIKGSGMSALAQVLYDNGHIVKGIDTDEYFFTQRPLCNIRIENFNDFKLSKSYIYIIGNAYINHDITKLIIKNKFKYYTYPNFINTYFKNYRFIAVSGSHGKTTTAKILATIIPNSSYIIGDGSGCGKGKTSIIVEACEYKNTFLNYNPDISIVLNVDYDHPDFFKSEFLYKRSFNEFIKKSNLVIMNGDNYDYKYNNIITYGMDYKNDIDFTYKIENNRALVSILDNEYTLPFLGMHYAYDFVAAYIVAKLLDIDDEYIKEKLKHFKMPKRRFQKVLFKNCEAYLDYAHHPTEIACVYNTIKELYKNKNIICIFQPHTLSRTEEFLDDFKKSLSLFNEVYLLPIFTSVREKVDEIKEKNMYDKLGYKIIHKINDINYNTDNVYVFLGAGDIDKLVLND